MSCINNGGENLQMILKQKLFINNVCFHFTISNFLNIMKYVVWHHLLYNNEIKHNGNLKTAVLFNLINHAC